MNDLIEKLSILRSQFNCFDENERDEYHTLSEAIKVLSERSEPCEDTVSRQTAIDALLKEVRLVDGYYVENDEVIDKDDAIEAIRSLPSAQPEPCEDAVSRADVLECFADLYDTFEDCSKGIINELYRKFEDLRTLPSVAPKQNTGKWIYKNDLKQFFCSECGFPSLTYDDTYIYGMDLPNYCEDCGSRMERIQDEI